jgi:hypothetical protein
MHSSSEGIGDGSRAPDPIVQSFRLWVRSLSWSELQQAMTFCVRNNHFGDPSFVKSSARNSGAAPNLVSSRDELDLLEHMVQLQMPLPTPIHPRAISYLPASKLGRGYVEENHHNSFSKALRWLRFIGHDDGNGTAEDELWSALQNNLQDGFAKASKSTFRTQRRKKVKSNKGGIHQQATLFASVDVIARQFRNADGTCLTAEGVSAQQEADLKMLSGTATLQLDQTTDGLASAVMCRFDPVRSTAFQLPNTTQDFVRMLFLTSRGYFSSRKVDAVSLEEVEHTAASSLYPPWFDPTDRWFPLSMYLAARFEMALWKSFYQLTPSAIDRAISSHPRTWDENMDDSTLCTLFSMSVVETVKDLLAQERQKFDSSSCFFMRDCFLWDALVNGSTNVKSTTSLLGGWKASDLLVCPLMELGTKPEALRQQIRSRLQLRRTEVSVQLLLREDVEGAVSDETKAVSNTTKKLATSSKRHLGKKKKKSAPSKAAKESKGISSTVTGSMDQDSLDSSSSSDGLDFEARIRIAGKRREENSVCIPDGVSARVRSRHTLLALSVINDVMNDVFRQVGLASVESEHVSVGDKEDVSAHSGRQAPTTSISLSQPISGELSERENSPITFSDGRNVARQSVGAENAWHFVDDRIFTPMIHHVDDAAPFYQDTHFLSVDPTATIRTSNLQGFSSLGYPSLSPQFFHHHGRFDEATWDVPGYPASESWNRFRGIDRNESIFTDFFHAQGNDPALMASSTAASIASSDKGYDGDSAPEVHELDFVDDTFLTEDTEPEMSDAFSEQGEIVDLVCVATPTPDFGDDDKSRSSSEFHSPSPPSTPSPTLSPILVSLAELSQLPKESLELLQIPSSQSLSTDTIASHSSCLNGEPLPDSVNTSTPYDDLRACASVEEHHRKIGSQLSILSKSISSTIKHVKCRDDHDIIDKATVRRSADALKSYRNVVISRGDALRSDQFAPDREISKHSPFKSTAPRSTSAVMSKVESPRRFQFDFVSSHDKNDGRRYTRSDFDGNDDYQKAWHEAAAFRSDDADNNTVSKDGTATISSSASQRDSEEMATLREQRNAFRDMSLTLGAEVAKLKNVLAAQKIVSCQPFLSMQSGDSYQQFRNADVFDPATIPRVFQFAPRARTLAALSDAGYRGEQESHASEDEVGARMLVVENNQQTNTASDVSIGYNSLAPIEHMQLGLQSSRSKNDFLSPSAIQSRLSRDIFQFMERNSAQLRHLDSKVQAAVERMNRLVKTVWPRAQVKLYGSHVTGLSVVTSDLDFVVCLPAVHKNAVAVAPGALEGRNAINETSQKLLARRLKGESWIDPRSMKMIDRTAVPVIKVSTKDTKKYTLHLDISFDGPGHHGLEAAQMISSILNELPMLRPLVVVLKQFLIERSLLEAYTGGSIFCVKPLPCSCADTSSLL